MSTKKKLVLLWHDAGFPEVYNHKCEWLFPKYLAKEYGVPYEIVVLNEGREAAFGGKVQEDEHGRGGNLCKLANKHGFKSYPSRYALRQCWLFLIPYISYLVKNRKNISHFMVFHYINITWYMMFFCRLLCPHAKIYLRLDASLNGAKRLANTKPNHNTFWRRFILKRVHGFATSLPHLTSIECSDAFEVLKANPIFAKRNIAYIPSGVECRPVGTVRKQKRFFTVGRLGTEQKNTEMLLAACAAVELKDWQFWFVGGIEKTEQDFQAVIDRFFAAHPEKREQMIFTGNISDPARLWQIYDESSVFIFPSRSESFGNAAIEACYAGCYLLLSEVGCARDVSEACGGEGVRILGQSKTGQQDEAAMQQQIEDAMRAIISGEVSISFDRQKRREEAESHFLMENIVKCEAFKAFFADKRAQ